MTTQTDPQDRLEIRTADDLLTAMRAGVEIATRSDVYESERRIVERFDERLNAQDRRTDDRFDDQDRRIGELLAAQDRRTDDRFDAQDRRDAQDARMDAQGARADSFNARMIKNTATIKENTAAIRALTAAAQAKPRTKDRVIQWLLLGLAALGALVGILGFAVGVLSN